MPNNEHERIEAVLSATQPQDLTSAERARIVAAVEAGIPATPMPSPYFPFAFTTPTMIPLALVLAFFFGVGGTAVASDAARPGDFLFPVDRAIEDLRLSLSHDKEDLRIAFANERLNEFSSIVDEEFGDHLAGATLTEAEADIFTNETIVKLEAVDRKAVFSTDADTREEIIAAIRTRFDFTEADIDAVLVVETEDRASRA
ncbi:MAG TPA: DUF5667 domain-containing protein, partial [Candidatus Paceibacterota bacterium]|nr:DUF5667 domain-containing protein [Candidatus Paceibacterota bacterium]